VAYSGLKWGELVEESHGATLYDLDWAFEADHDDTDLEPDSDAADEGSDVADSAVANPSDGEADVADSAVAGPAVANPQPKVQLKLGSGSSCGGSRAVVMTPRKVRLKPASPKLYAQRGKMQVFHMTNTGFHDDAHTSGTTSDLRNTTYEDDTIPCRYGMRDVHMATYVLSALSDPSDLVYTLRNTGMPIVVLVLTEIVAPTDHIYIALKRWAKVAQEYNGRQPPEGSEAASVLEYLDDKRIVSVGKRGDIFVCLHKDRVKAATFEERVLSCRERDIDEDMQFGTLTVHFHDGGCEPGDSVRIGLAVIRHRMTDPQIEALAQWIILHRIAVLTGIIARSHDHRTCRKMTVYNSAWVAQTSQKHSRDSPLMDLAKKTRAIGDGPLFQEVDMADHTDERKIWAIPIPWLFFGFEKAIKQPCSVARPSIDARNMTFGTDLEHELMEKVHIPCWPPNTAGNAYVPFLDVIRMTPIDWKRWFDGCFMSAVRFGKSITQKRNQKTSRHLEAGDVERKVKRRRGRTDEEDG